MIYDYTIFRQNANKFLTLLTQQVLLKQKKVFFNVSKFDLDLGNSSLTSEWKVGSTSIFLVQVPVKQAVVDFAEGLPPMGSPMINSPLETIQLLVNNDKKVDSRTNSPLAFTIFTNFVLYFVLSLHVAIVMLLVRKQ